MKTRVNLYSASLLPVKLLVSFNHLINSLIALLILASLVGATIYSFTLSLTADNADLQKTAQQLNSQKAELEAALSARKPNQQLVKQVELLAQQVELKRLLLTKLDQQEALTSFGYSQLFKDLANVSEPHLWLNRISVVENRFIFEGYTDKPHYVPLWVDKLSGTETLQGHAFATMTMDRGDNQPLSFRLTSQLDIEEEK